MKNLLKILREAQDDMMFQTYMVKKQNIPMNNLPVKSLYYQVYLIIHS